jgi:hypothetical protein
MPSRATPILILACLALGAPAWAQTTLHMRGGVPPPPGDITAVDAQGVTISLAGPAPTPPANATNKAAPRPPSSTTTVIAWDRVAGVEGELASAAAPFMPAAERLWRARSRLDRGDVVGAEPIFEELFPAFAGKRGPTAAVAAGGLLRCRLGTGAQTAAVAPWLAYINALGENDQPLLASADADPTAPPAIDPSTGLAPSLPPIWVSLPAVQSLARGPWPMNAGGDVRPRAAILSAYYEQAARFESGLPIQVPTANVERDDAVALVREMVMSRIGDETQRGVARQALSARLKRRIMPWMEAWVRTALGRSMLLESSRDTQLLGVAELAELPARLERVNPYLTGIALAEAAVATAKLGDAAGATQLRNELSDRFPGHPALEWEPLRGWSSTAPTPIPNPAPAPPPASPDPSKGGPA